MSEYCLQYAISAWKGLRERQEDCCRVRLCLGGEGPPLLAAALADGMGGHAGGASASQIVAGGFITSLLRRSGSIESRMVHALDDTNRSLARAMERNNSLMGMGSTLLGVVIDGGGLRWLSVGDSPLYLFRQGKLTRLNEDHSLAPVLDRMARNGEIGSSEASHHPKRSMLRSAVAGGEISLVELRDDPLVLNHRDWLLLASDGLATIDASRIARLITRNRSRGAQAVAGALIEAVRQEGRENQDNVTVLAIGCEHIDR